MIVDRRAPHRRAPRTAVYDRPVCHHPPTMRVLEPRIRPRHRTRHAAPAPTPAPPSPPALAGLTALELEELLLAVGDREDMVGADARARLARGRRALERELDRALSQ